MFWFACVRICRVDAFFALAQLVLIVSAFLSEQIALTRITFLQALICCIDLFMEAMHCEPTEDIADFLKQGLFLKLCVYSNLKMQNNFSNPM